jgi:hypothetical protein
MGWRNSTSRVNVGGSIVILILLLDGFISFYNILISINKIKLVYQIVVKQLFGADINLLLEYDFHKNFLCVAIKLCTLFWRPY